VYGLAFWLPTILKRLSGLPNLLVTLIAALPYAVALVAMVLVGRSSDRTKERRWHTALSMAAAALGLVLTTLFQTNLPFAVAFFCLAAAGLYSFSPTFWALTTTYLTGSAAAAAIGLINSIGNLGGFVGPAVVGRLNQRSHSFFTSIVFLSLSALAASGIVLALRPAGTKRAASIQNE
ncbi:MAG TPA: MFS transporter, partial [Blastocatellia bacterium]|nr:MFS transporter [Blastocatellia bacterium]